MKSRRNRKLVSVLLTLTLLVTLLVPMVSPASASSTYSISNVVSLSPNQTGGVVTAGMGNINITLDRNSLIGLNSQKYVFMRLPDTPKGYEMGFTVQNGAYGDFTMAGSNAITSFRVYGEPQAAAPSGIDAWMEPVAPYEQRSVNGKSITFARTWKISVQSASENPLADDGLLTLSGVALFLPSGANTGEIKVNFSAPSSSIFSNGDLAIAKLGSSTALLSVDSVLNMGSGGGDVYIYIKESNQGAIDKDLKLKLPPGFSWVGAPTVDTVFWGNASVLRNNNESNGGQGLSIAITDSENREVTLKPFGNGDFLPSASYFTLKGTIDVDETVAKTGDVVVYASGTTTVSPSNLVVAKYGDFKVNIAAVGDPTTVMSGKVEDQYIGQFKIYEDIAGSMMEQRTVTLTLPDNVRWVQPPSLDSGLSTQAGVTFDDFQAIGTDGKTLKLTFTGKNTSTDPAVLVFKDAKVFAAADFNGDLDVQVGGSQGLSGTITLAKVASPVDIKVSAVKDVMIGKNSQEIGDITITEKYAGALDSTARAAISANDNKIRNGSNSNDYNYVGEITGGQAKLSLYAPAGVYFETTPTVTVTDGDLSIDNAIVQSSISRNQGQIDINIRAASTKPSTIKLSGIKINVDRTVAEGSLRMWVGGTAVNCDQADSIGGVKTSLVFSPERYSGNAIVANCVTPAPNAVSGNAVFKIGDTKYSVNGNEKTMDVAPYLKNDRTYLPVRFVAQALGVTDNNILWNPDEQSVVLIKGSSVVKLVIGSNTMMINGIAVTMDTAPEIVDPGRTMLPLRWVAQALGADISWDAATQSVTVKTQG